MARLEQGSREELTHFSTFTVNNVGGTIVGQREVSGEMVGGWMEGGRTVEVPCVQTDEDFLKVKKIIAYECEAEDLDKITEDTHLINDLAVDSLIVGNLGMRFSDEILKGNNFPAQLAAVIGTVGHIHQALDILLLDKSSMPEVPLETAKLQLINAWMYQRASEAREKVEGFDDSSISEIKMIEIGQA